MLAAVYCYVFSQFLFWLQIYYNYWQPLFPASLASGNHPIMLTKFEDAFHPQILRQHSSSHVVCTLSQFGRHSLPD